MADEFENMENTTTEDDGQISEDDWAAAMSEQAVSESVGLPIYFLPLAAPGRLVE